MENLFETVLGMSGTASIVILAVLLVRLALRRAPKIFSYALWAVVLLRLLCPFTLESTFSLLPSVQLSSVAGRGGTEAQTIRVDTGVSAVDQPVNDFFLHHPYQGSPVLPEDDITVPAPVIPQTGDDSTSDWRTVPAVIWLAGMTALLGWSALSLVRLRRKLAGAVPLEGTLWVRIAEGIPSPFVLGLSRPLIYLPAGLSEEEREYILLHERTHIRRKDHILRALAWLAVSIHWFNPLVWLAFRLAGKDMEMSCDEAVLKNMFRDIRADYSTSLLRLSAGGQLPAGPLAFGDSDPKSRIKNILRYKDPALGVVAAATVAVACIGVGLATNQTSLHIDRDFVTSCVAFDAASYTITEQNTIVYTPADREKDLQNPVSTRTLTTEEWNTPIRLINSHGKKIWDRGDFTLNGSEHHFLRINCADGSFYLVDYWYWNGFSFNPLHAGEDDYTTLVSYFDPQGNIGTTWQMDYSFDHAYRQWRPSIEVTGFPADRWVDYYDREDLLWDEYRDILLPEFPNVTFRWRPGSVEAFEADSDTPTSEMLFTGMPVWNVYLCDLNGDGCRELCATVSFGSGLIDDHIVVYDYANRREYTLWDREVYDYVLSTDLNYLTVTKSEYNGEVVATGRLVLTEDGQLDIQKAPVDNTPIMGLHPNYELGEEEGTVQVTRLWNAHVEWNYNSYTRPSLYFAGSPGFFCNRLTRKTVEGTAKWIQDDPALIEVSMSVDDEQVESGTIDGFHIYFVVRTDSGSITKKDFTSWVEGETLPMTDQEIVYAARTFARLLREAEAFYFDNVKPSDPQVPASATAFPAPITPEEGYLPFEEPMKLWFGSGAGGWATILTLHPDGSFEGDYTDADMDTEYVCQFHGRFNHITQITVASWSMTLEELVLDTKRPVDEEWDEDGIHYVSSEPYGFDDKDGEALKPGAKFTFYTPEASGKRGGELYGMENESSPLYEFWTWWPKRYAISGGSGGKLNCYALHNVTSGRGFFDFYSWGIL